MNMNNQYGRGRGKGGPLGLLVSGVATGIGLASESIHHHKEKKVTAEKAATEQSSPSLHPPTNSEFNSAEGIQKSKKAEESYEEESEKELHEEGDEEQWDLDDALD
jgi:hypothetical protein